VLDHPTVADTELKPKRTTPFGGVGESARHLSYEDLDAYVNGRVPPDRLNHCHTHLDSCLACRAELEDLRTLKSEASGFQRPAPLGRELERRRKRRTLTLVQTATVAIIFVAVASTAIWRGRDRLPAKKPPIAATVTQIASPPVATVPSPASSPPVATAQPPTSAGAPQTNKGFALLSPFGEAIAEPRPEFHWTPLAGAVRYSVAIVDERLHPVQHSRALRTTGWRPRRPLRRGRTYLWQVTATLRGGSTVVASGPSASGALLRISPK